MNPRKIAAIAAALTLTMSAAACGSDDGDKVAADAGKKPDLTKAETQAKEFYTVGMVDDWNNYGPLWQGFFDQQGWKYNGFASSGGGETNRSNNDDASSADVLTEFASKTGGKVPVCGDIGIAFAPPLEQQKLGLAYTPAGAEDLADAYRGDGWTAHVAGVPSFLVNTDKVKNPPTSWEDLKKPEYKGLIAIKDPTESGTAQAMVLAAAAALGEGDEFDLDAAIEYFNELENAGQFNEAGFDEATFETGETPIFIGYDFTNMSTRKAMKQTGVNASVTIPTDGSIFAPSVVTCNAKTDKPDLAKAFLDYMFTDEGQKILAQSGGHPIRAVTGELKLSQKDMATWLPEEQYSPVEEFTGDSWPTAQEIAQRWTDEVLNK